MSRGVVVAAVVGVAALAAGAIGGYWLASRHAGHPSVAAVPSAPASTADKIDPKTGRKVLYWHDPMTPGPRFDQPGKSPFMDMPLVPVYADEAADEGKVGISPRTVQNLGIRAVEVKEVALDTGFAAVGTVTIDERGISTVQSRVNGYIEKLHVRAQYDSVAAGQALAEIYAPDWLSAQEEYLALKQSKQPAAEMIAEAARDRLKLLGISEEQIQTLDREGKPNPRVTLYATEGGVVWELGTREGMAVSPGMTLFKLANLRTVWVNAEVPETQAELARPGASVRGRVTALPGKLFEGRIAMLLPDVNPTTRTLKARIILDNPRGELKPGMFATLAFGGRDKPALVVPTEAVISTGTRNVVIVKEREAHFRPVEVVLGRESGELTEIRQGLQPGQQVVVSGQFLIDSEASLRSTLTRMNEPSGSQPTAPSSHAASHDSHDRASAETSPKRRQP